MTWGQPVGVAWEWGTGLGPSHAYLLLLAHSLRPCRVGSLVGVG